MRFKNSSVMNSAGLPARSLFWILRKTFSCNSMYLCRNSSDRAQLSTAPSVCQINELLGIPEEPIVVSMELRDIHPLDSGRETGWGDAVAVTTNMMNGIIMSRRNAIAEQQILNGLRGRIIESPV